MLLLLLLLLLLPLLLLLWLLLLWLLMTIVQTSVSPLLSVQVFVKLTVVADVFLVVGVFQLNP